MWALILPVLLPAAVQLIAFAYNRKMLSDAQRQAFLDFVQAMSIETNESKLSHDKFKELHEQLKEMK